MDTTEATTQADTFDSNKEGVPLGGGPPETTTCKGRAYGKTVWYDFAPSTRHRISAAAGFPVVARLRVEPEELADHEARAVHDERRGRAPAVDSTAGKYYTVQVGGVGGAGGPVALKADIFPDTDSDGVYDGIDDCPAVPGIGNGGCPPELKVTPRLRVESRRPA